jgi:hypothetical protein
MAERRAPSDLLASIGQLKDISHGRDLASYITMEIENTRDRLEDCTPEELASLQGEAKAYRRILKHVA